jgi:hypothetical protein
MTEKEWLANETTEARRLSNTVFTQYDDGTLTLSDAKHRIAVIIESTMSRVYDHAFLEGTAQAELDGDSSEEEFDFEFDEGDEDDDDFNR